MLFMSLHDISIIKEIKGEGKVVGSNPMFRRLIDRNKYIILEQNGKEIWDQKTLNGCLQSV